MRDSTLRIVDKDGKAVRMAISTPSNKNKVYGGLRKLPVARDFLPDFGSIGHWEILDEGFLRYRKGRVRPRFSSNGDLTTRDLLILGSDGIQAHDGRDVFGMQLFEYEDLLNVNHKGEGFVIQPWVISLTPGRISWRVIE